MNTSNKYTFMIDVFSISKCDSISAYLGIRSPEMESYQFVRLSGDSTNKEDSQNSNLWIEKSDLPEFQNGEFVSTLADDFELKRLLEIDNEIAKEEGKGYLIYGRSAENSEVPFTVRFERIM